MLKEPAYIRADLTRMQRAHIKSLKKQIEELSTQGIHKTIRYINNIPTLIDHDPNYVNGKKDNNPEQVPTDYAPSTSTQNDDDDTSIETAQAEGTNTASPSTVQKKNPQKTPEDPKEN